MLDPEERDPAAYPYGKPNSVPSPRTITVFSGPTQTKRDELRMNVKPGGVHITKWTVYSTGKEVQRSEQWFTLEEARALRNALDAIS